MVNGCLMSAQNTQQREESSTVGVRKTEYPYVEEWNWTHILYTEVNKRGIKDLNGRVKFVEQFKE